MVRLYFLKLELKIALFPMWLLIPLRGILLKTRTRSRRYADVRLEGAIEGQSHLS